MLDEKGRPTITERALIMPPQGQIGPIDAATRQQIIQNSLVAGVYEKAVDRESAYEILKARAVQRTAAEAEAKQTTAQQGGAWGDVLGGIFGGGNSRRQSVGEAVAKSAARAIGSEVGRQIIRGVLGSILGGGKRR